MSESSEIPEAEFGKWADGQEDDVAVVKFDSNLNLETADKILFKYRGDFYKASVMKVYNEVSNLPDELQVFSDDVKNTAIITVRSKKNENQKDLNYPFIL